MTLSTTVRLSRYLPALADRDIAVDLGRANTVVFVRGEGVVLFQPSVVAIDEGSGEVYAVGDEARRMIGRTPASIRALRPLRHGVIADYEMTEQMLRHFMQAAIGRRYPRRASCSVCQAGSPGSSAAPWKRQLSPRAPGRPP